MTHTADQIIEAMARALDPLSWEERDQILSAEGSSWRTDEIVLGSVTLARAAYAVCLRMLREPTTAQCDSTGLVHAMPDYHWRAMIDERIKELG